MNRFLVADYKPTETDVVVSYTIHPLHNDSFHECLHELAAFLGETASIQIKVFDFHQESFTCRIAFHEQYFEAGNIIQNLSVLAGNIFDVPSAQSVRIEQIDWSDKLLKTFPGPLKGIQQMREEMGILERPLNCGMLMSSGPLNIKESIEKAYLMWMGGCDLVMDHEVIPLFEGQKFEERVDFLSQEMKGCEERTKSRKSYIPNITSVRREEIRQRAEYAKKAGIQIVSINAIQTGWSGLISGLQICQELHLSLFIHLNGIGQLTRGPFGWSMVALASLYRLLGADFVSLDVSSKEIHEACQALIAQARDLKPTFPSLKGAIHPGEIESILKDQGYDLILQMSRGITQHPDGIKAGAEAAQQAIEMATQGIELDAALKNHDALRRSIEHWSKMMSYH